jgi:hypothetical protein
MGKKKNFDVKKRVNHQRFIAGIVADRLCVLDDLFSRGGVSRLDYPLVSAQEPEEKPKSTGRRGRKGRVLHESAKNQVNVMGGDGDDEKGSAVRGVQPVPVQ